MDKSDLKMSLATGTALTAVTASGFLGTGLYFPTEPINIAFIGMWSTLAYFGASFRRSIKANEIAVLDRFGKPLRILGPGLAFALLGIYNLTYLQTDVVQREFPAEPQLIWRTSDPIPQEKKDAGYRPPVEISFRNAVTEIAASRALLGENDYTVLDLKKMPEKVTIPSTGATKNWRECSYAELDEVEAAEIIKDNGCYYTFKPEVPEDGLARRMDAEVAMVTTWRIEDGIAFIKTMGTEDPIGSANQQIEDMMVSVLSRLLPNVSVSQANQNIGWTNAHLFLAIHKRTLEWGVKIENAYLKPIKSPSEVSDAQSAFASAEFTGNAERELATKRGDGAANARRAILLAEAHGEADMLAARAQGMREIAEATGTTGAEAMAAEVARAVAEGGNTVIIGQEGFGQLAGIVGAMTKQKPAPEKKGGDEQE
jgi:regulator of protease activity HflC (stomatin/prohibitin superfamily)